MALTTPQAFWIPDNTLLSLLGLPPLLLSLQSTWPAPAPTRGPQRHTQREALTWICFIWSAWEQGASFGHCQGCRGGRWAGIALGVRGGRRWRYKSIGLSSL